jgi:hypothetical protein
VIRHPQLDDHCVTFREWAADDDEAGDDLDDDEIVEA